MVCAACRARLSSEDQAVRTIHVAFGEETDLASNVTMMPFQTHLPLYAIEVAAGKFGKQQVSREPESWIEISESHRPLTEDMFVTHIKGDSMVPLIPDGSLCAFRSRVCVPYDGKILLMEEYGEEAGGNRYSVKRYRAAVSRDVNEKGDSEWLHERITLESINPVYAPLEVSSEEKVGIVGEFVFVVNPIPGADHAA